MPYGSARLPQGNAQQIEVEKAIGQVKAEKGTAEVFKDLFWSKDVILFEGEGKGSKIEIPFDVPEDGDYELYTEVAQASDYGIYTVLLDGKPPVAPVLEHEPGADVRPQHAVRRLRLETYVGMDYQVGWPRLTKGRHTLTFVCLGKNAASSRLQPRRGQHRAGEGRARRPGRRRRRREAVRGGPERLCRARRGRSRTGTRRPGARRARARDDGRGRGPRLDALAARLKDPDPVVRTTAAEALASIGPKAAPAVPALIAAAGVADENVNVLRACAEALGAIGPAAAAALPVLREIAKLPRARWAAEAAIRKIDRGAP